MDSAARESRISQNVEFWYLLQAEMILKAPVRPNRTGVDTHSKFYTPLTHCFDDGFPLLTTKKMFWRGIVGELLWFLKGRTDVKWLNDRGIHIWDAWADDSGNLNRIYGAQWRGWRTPKGTTVDQIAKVVDSITNDPHGRRHIVSAWNPGETDEMALPPCHMMAQFYVDGNALSLCMYQRSADWFLGVPFNVASYALLLSIIAKQVGLIPYMCHYTFGDSHIYTSHVEGVNEQLSRNPKSFPAINFPLKPIEEYEIEDFELLHYNPAPSIKAPIAV